MAGVVFLGSLLLLPVIGSQFFPAGSRDQFFIKVWLPEGSPIGATVDAAKQVETILKGLVGFGFSTASGSPNFGIIVFLGTDVVRSFLDSF